MSYSLKTTKRFTDDLLNLRNNSPKLFKKVGQLLQELESHPRSGTGHPERLKHYSEETWSRQINKQHRLVYEIKEDVVTIVLLSAYGHYDDK